MIPAIIHPTSNSYFMTSVFLSPGAHNYSDLLKQCQGISPVNLYTFDSSKCPSHLRSVGFLIALFFFAPQTKKRQHLTH